MIIYEYIDDYLLDDESEDKKEIQAEDASTENQSEEPVVEEIQKPSSSDEQSEEIVVEEAQETPLIEGKTEEISVKEVKKASLTDGQSEEASVEEEHETSLNEGKSEDVSIEEVKGSSLANELSEEATIINNKVDESNNEITFPHIIGKKIRMTQLFSDNGNSLPATILEVGPCSITQIKKESHEGYSSIQLAFKDLKENKVNKSQVGHFSKSNVSPKRYLKEFRCKDNNDFKLGDVITLNQFDLGDFVKITGVSKGKGFTGHMKRHGFSGGRRSHGKNSVMRKAGSIGAGSDPSRVFPGMKMAGRKGNYKKTIKNLSVIKIDYDNNLIFVKGSVPGANNGLIYLSKI